MNEEVLDEVLIDDNIDIVKFVEYILQQNRGSDKIQDMLTAQEYFLVKNVDILKKEDPNSIKSSNKKLTSALYRLSVEQKVNYAFNNDIIFSFENNSENEESLIFETYQNEFMKFMDFDNKNTIINMATDAVNKGISWAFVNIDDEGKLILQDFEPETVYPVWINRQHNSLRALVRDYKVKDYVDNDFVTINKIDYFDNENHYNLIYDNEVEIDNSQDTSHFYNNGVGESWGRVPFIWLKSNQDELPLLNVIKSYLDAYDELTSKSVDTLINDIDAILVLKGVNPDMGTLEETREKIKKSKVLSLKEIGDASYLVVNSDISSIQSKLESLYKNIMQYSSTVDTNDVKFGSNNSGIALKSMYQNLDIYVNGLERQLRITFANIKYFFDEYLVLNNIGSLEDFQKFKINVMLDRDLMINETEIINNVAKMQNLVSQETLDDYNPLVYSYDNEEKRREETRKKIDEIESNYDFTNEVNDLAEEI